MTAQVKETEIVVAVVVHRRRNRGNRRRQTPLSNEFIKIIVLA